MRTHVPPFSYPTTSAAQPRKWGCNSELSHKKGPYCLLSPPPLLLQATEEVERPPTKIKAEGGRTAGGGRQVLVLVLVGPTVASFLPRTGTGPLKTTPRLSVPTHHLYPTPLLYCTHLGLELRPAVLGILVRKSCIPRSLRLLFCLPLSLLASKR